MTGISKMKLYYQNVLLVWSILVFHQGVTASYFGISETIIHFVIYEHVKALLRSKETEGNRFSHYMVRILIISFYLFVFVMLLLNRIYQKLTLLLNNAVEILDFSKDNEVSSNYDKSPYKLRYHF